MRSKALGTLSVAMTLALLMGQEFGPNSFRVTSSTFQEGQTLPISMIYEAVAPGSTTNVCSINGSTGLNESPELSWAHVPPQTRSLVVTAFDTTAGFVHWGMYNISPKITSLPSNAGVAGSGYGIQVVNGFGDQSYDGPCPPSSYPPNVHQYVFTVYALDEMLNITNTANFPPTGPALYRALADAAIARHVLATASIEGYYSTTPI